MLRLGFCLAALAIAGALGGCMSKEWIAIHDLCTESWTRTIPPDLQQVVVQKTRRISVPDGKISCVTHGNKTDCTQGERYEDIPYTDVEFVDLNESRRDMEIANCTASTCRNNYGNVNCERRK